MVLPSENRTAPVQVYDAKFLKMYKTGEGFVFASRKSENETVYAAVLRDEEIKPDVVVICATMSAIVPIPVVHQSGAEGVEAVETRIIVVNQYRPPIGQFIWELPAGLIDEGETPEQAGKREFNEETGMIISRVIRTSPLIYASPGMCDESKVIIHCLCEGKPSKERQQEVEDIDIRAMDKVEAKQLLQSGEPMGVQLAACLELFTGGLLD